MQPPCTDEKRIALKAGDQVAVTRWKRYSAVWQAKLALVTKLWLFFNEGTGYTAKSSNGMKSSCAPINEENYVVGFLDFAARYTLPIMKRKKIKAAIFGVQ